jgi:hypothetical protein
MSDLNAAVGVEKRTILTVLQMDPAKSRAVYSFRQIRVASTAATTDCVMISISSACCAVDNSIHAIQNVTSSFKTIRRFSPVVRTEEARSLERPFWLVGNWSLTSLQQRLEKTGGRLIKHARYYWLLLAESHLTRRLFGGMLRRIVALHGGGGIRRAQSGANFDDDARSAGKSVCGIVPKKSNSRRCVPTRCERPLLAPLETP